MTARQKLNEVCDELNTLTSLLVDAVSSLNTVYITLGLRTRAELRFVSLSHSKKKRLDDKAVVQGGSPLLEQ